MRPFDINRIHESVDQRAESRDKESFRQSQLADLVALGRGFLAAFPQAEEDYNYVVSRIHDLDSLHPEVLEDYLPVANRHLTAAEEAWLDLCAMYIYNYNDYLRSQDSARMVDYPVHLIQKHDGLNLQSFKETIYDRLIDGLEWRVRNPDFYAPDIGEAPDVKLDRAEAGEYVDERMETLMRCFDFLQVSVEEIRSAFPRGEF